MVIVEKKRNFCSKLVLIGVLVGGLVTSCPCRLPAMAAEEGSPSGRIRSTGRMEYGEVVLDAADLEDICAYITEKQNAASDILLRLGARFRQNGGEIEIDRNPDSAQGEIDRSKLNWELLNKAAEQSQTVPVSLPVLHPEYAMRIEGVEERTDDYETAVADNISLGKAAWADGILLLGNGADNDKAYRQGLKDGEQGSVPGILYPVYAAEEVMLEVRHVHIGTEEDVEGTNGCYHNYSETKKEEKKCGRTLHQTPKVWYPDDSNPDGGSWHGGYYTCGTHGGTYSSSGTCPHKSVTKTTIWHHDITCGLTDVVYAVIHIRGNDADYYDRAILLEAELEEREGYEQFAWQEGDELLWTDAENNLLGIGSELTVEAPGVYQCCINVANTDIDIRSADVEVAVVGLVLPR
ncbi:MAG: hypothetical protein J6A08_08495 [Lachnospiraceae bacterium]|nr:hypothetical protein [Lachnospiraceae bacterium]